MHSLIVREPFREMMSLREAMDKLFEDSFVGPRWMPFGGDGGTLPLDVYDSGDSIVVSAPVPGTKPEDIDITIAGDTLTIKGETKFEEKVEKANYIRQERRFGQFERSLSLPTQVQTDKIEAVFENGVLKLTLPKAEAVKPKQIKVSVK
jgi:HSP20 family protein